MPSPSDRSAQGSQYWLENQSAGPGGITWQIQRCCANPDLAECRRCLADDQPAVSSGLNWDHVGHANDVVAMAAINGKLFGAGFRHSNGGRLTKTPRARD